MSSAEPPSTKSPSNDDPVARKNDSGGRWVLTKEALDRLLEQFSPDRDEAARKYEVMRIKLIRYFEWKSSPAPEDEADKTMNRVARKIEEGENIYNISGYFRTVARNVFLESLPSGRVLVPFDELQELPDIPVDPLAEDDQKETRLRCLDECLGKQSSENRKLILGYYVDVKRAKIDHRRKLAESSTINALRIRACRIRKDLEKCVKECLKRSSAGNEYSSKLT